jgi:hypothetical protein
MGIYLGYFGGMGGPIASYLPQVFYFPARIPGRYLHILASIISLTYTLIAPTVFKCECPHQGTRSGGGYEEGDP